MLESANDAAEALAEGIAGSESRFVAAMNERAKQLGLDDTSYANPIGLDDPLNYSTARDLASLTFDSDAAAALRSRGRHPLRPARVRRPPAHGRQPQPADRRLPVRERGQDGPHLAGRLRAGRVGAGAQRRPGDLGGDGRAERGGARRRHPQAAALGSQPLPPRARARPPARARSRRHRISRRAGRASYPNGGPSSHCATGRT